ncbi:MAG: hypothetical protein KC620_19665, partial [Myxococcales bacterium]|nr:hypothetical protein [Myxococcales bacterium]
GSLSGLLPRPSGGLGSVDAGWTAMAGDKPNTGSLPAVGGLGKPLGGLGGLGKPLGGLGKPLGGLGKPLGGKPEDEKDDAEE